MKTWNELSARDRSILEHIGRYRVSTDDILQELFFPSAKSITTIQKHMARLTEAEWTKKSNSVARRNIYYLGDQFHLPRSRRNGFTEQSLPTAIAILYFCIRHGRKRMALSELRALDPRLAEPRMRGSDYFVDDIGGKLGLSFMLVDRLGPVRRIVWKANRLVRQRLARAAYREWIIQRRFSVTVLAATPQQTEQLTHGLKRRKSRDVPVRVQTVPEFAPFLPISN